MSTPPADHPGQSPDAEPGAGAGPDQPARVSPLLPDDPPRIGEFWLDSRVTSSASGVAFAGHTTADEPVIIILLSRGAADDPAARDRLAGLVNAMHIDHVLARGGLGQDTGRLARKFVDQSDRPDTGEDGRPAPWVALAWDGGPAGAVEASGILASIRLDDLPPLGTPSGPDYRLHWIDRVKPGLARLWPLPWPGRYDRAGWVTILVSWLLMLLLAAIAVLIAILIFHNAPPQSPQDQPSTSSSGSGSPQSGSPPPQSGSPSPQSASPSPGEGTPTKTPSMSGSPSGSPSPSGSESGGGGSPQPSDSGSPGGGASPRSKL